MTKAMRDFRRLTLPALGLLGAALVLAFAGARGATPAADSAGFTRYRVDAATAKRDRVPLLPAAVRSATFHFAPGTAPADRDSSPARSASAGSTATSCTSSGMSSTSRWCPRTR
jgi:hypothetical protein